MNESTTITESWITNGKTRDGYDESLDLDAALYFFHGSNYWLQILKGHPALSNETKQGLISLSQRLHAANMRNQELRQELREIERALNDPRSHKNERAKRDEALLHQALRALEYVRATPEGDWLARQQEGGIIDEAIEALLREAL